MVRLPGAEEVYLVTETRLLPWTPHGYAPGRPREPGTVELVTPPSTVDVLLAGYQPMLHPSAFGTG